MRYLLLLLSLTAYADNPPSFTNQVTQVRTVYSSTNVTTGAYVQIVASLGFTATSLDIFDSSGQTLKLAVGSSGHEVDQFIIFPGGNGGPFPLRIPKGSRVSLKAISATANAGESDINFYNSFVR